MSAGPDDRGIAKDRKRDDIKEIHNIGVSECRMNESVSLLRGAAVGIERRGMYGGEEEGNVDVEAVVDRLEGHDGRAPGHHDNQSEHAQHARQVVLVAPAHLQLHVDLHGSQAEGVAEPPSEREESEEEEEEEESSRCKHRERT